MRPAVILVHPECVHSLQDIDRLEINTGRKAVIIGNIVSLVKDEDAYDMIERQACIGQIGDFPND